VSGGVALVTGASRGIGRAVAVELGSRGWKLVLSSRSGAALEETATLVREVGGDAATLTCDLSDRAQTATLVERATEAAGAPELLVHVAGVAPSAKIAEHDDESWDLAMELNATAAFVLARAALPAMMKADRGRIVMVASTAGRVGYPYTAAYTASKHALVGLTRALAVEVARHGITVNAACPGFTDTAIVDDAVKNISERTGVTAEEARRRLASMSPQQRLIDPLEIARLVAYLASDEAGGINGQAINIDGGAVTS
jgi:NAD(P)-dependent dehydrogenase (short-subunit alcohol dehydrogenase family)